MILSRFTSISNLILIRNGQKVFYNIPKLNPNNFNVRKLSESVNVEDETKKKKKTTIIPKITLMQGDNVTIVTMEEAQKMSKRRDLKLVKIIDLDTKTQRPVYKLMSSSEYLAEDLKQRERKKLEKDKVTIKGEKLLSVNHNISEHDLQVHIKKILKWLEKRYEVRVVINGDSSGMTKAENVFNVIEKGVGGTGKVLQKRMKGSDVKFQVMPPKKASNEDKNDQNND